MGQRKRSGLLPTIDHQFENMDQPQAPVASYNNYMANFGYSANAKGEAGLSAML
jgi:hypothetical protein